MVGRPIFAIGVRRRTFAGKRSPGQGGGHVCVCHTPHRPIGNVHGRSPTSVPVLFLPALQKKDGHHGLRTPLSED